jgi:hypothetical protein
VNSLNVRVDGPDHAFLTPAKHCCIVANPDRSHRLGRSIEQAAEQLDGFELPKAFMPPRHQRPTSTI